MRVDRIHPALLADQDLDVAVVIDVLRATSTAIVLLARGAGPVRIVEAPGDLAGLPAAPPSTSYLVFSEIEASRSSGLPRVDNSPNLAESLPLEGCAPVLVTTNGTRAVAAAVLRARTVFAASFLNLSSTARHLRGGAERVTLLPAGDFQGCRPLTEDERCADALEKLLLGCAPDLPALVADCWADPRVQGRIERHPELVRDVEIALDVDRYDVLAFVPVAASGRGLELVRHR